MGSIQQPLRYFDIKKICIIGAGPSGLAVAKHLLAESAYEAIDIIEQQAEVGGVWLYSNTSEQTSVPQISPHVKPARPVWEKNQTAPIFPNASKIQYLA